MTREEIKKLRKQIAKLREQDKTFQYIADKLNMSVQLVHYHFKEHGNNKREKSPKTD
jgi:orotate phosphoribosyltransferase-like protein